MRKVFATEVTSESIPSDNPIHQRLLQAYYLSLPYVKGHVLEVGCGEGRGFGPLLSKSERLTAVDRMESAIENLRDRYPEVVLHAMNLPPLAGLADNSFDTVVSFQVIEHIFDDAFFLQEIHRVLKPGGTAIMTTPNRLESLSRNPWHVREYTGEELSVTASRYFGKVSLKGIAGSERVMRYHERNRQSVNQLMRWDVFNLQYRLPAPLLRIPYEMLNRINRKRLYRAPDELAQSIVRTDYFLMEDYARGLDLFLVAEK